jgi:hypothetical protein
MKIKIVSIDRSHNHSFVVYKIKNKIFTMSFGNNVSNIFNELEKIHCDN